VETTVSEPLLRTLSPALAELGRNLRAWLNGKHRYPLSALVRANLEGMATDLTRQAEALQLERPLLVIMLMGGTGVGKSTLLNALGGGTIAQASYARPTTRDPVVYYHESIQPHRLDPALQHCKLVANDRPALEQKILVDTPDLDSNDLANREKLLQLLPVADIVLYVGSQEKYHDKLGWELFLQQRQRRAFAFVLNKWDRCSRESATGLSPDQDLLRDLEAEGFQNPQLFRTCAQFWADQLLKDGKPGEPGAFATGGPVPGEQFPELVHWLELGLTRLEIEAIKARGVSQLLHQLQQGMEAARPPELEAEAEKTRTVWCKILEQEARTNAAVLLTTLEPYQKEIEHHFAIERQRHFRGVMGTYLHWFNRLRYAGSTLRDRIPFMPKLATPINAPREWDLAAFTRACSDAASERHLDGRGRALANQLLVEADKEGFPVHLLSDATETTAKMDWRARYSQALVEVLQRVEHDWAKPKGFRRLLQNSIIFLADWLPLLAFGAMATVLLWQYFMVEDMKFAWYDLLKPPMVALLVMILLHVIIAIFLPLRWQAIRSEFEHQLEIRLQDELETAYCRLPGDLAGAMVDERRQVDKFLGEVREVSGWLAER
jgi:energy-coupling factor transporter ATP-binding protein EcfA2